MTPAQRPVAAPAQRAGESPTLERQRATYVAWAKRLKDGQVANAEANRQPVPDMLPVFVGHTTSPADPATEPGAEGAFDMDLLFVTSAEATALEHSGEAPHEIAAEDEHQPL